MNVPLTNFSAELDGRALVVPTAIPLAHQLSETGGNGTVVNTSADWVECLTCHNAHGASTTMTGWANVADPANDLRQNTGATFGGGVPPGPANSDLLKLDNRAVCQACHNK
jgi:hypothetical protein